MARHLVLLTVPVLLLVGCCITPQHGYVIADRAEREPLYVLSFDCEGKLNHPDDLEIIREKIAASPQTVVVFMHGWKGTAKPSDHNVRNFQATLKTVRRDSYSSGNRKLTAVYLTWNSRHLPVFLNIPRIG
jgi:hypothetical protein